MKPCPPDRAAKRLEIEAALGGGLDGWLQAVGSLSPELGRLLQAPPPEQEARGFGHTAREIAQQPLTWRETTSLALLRASAFEAEVARLRRDGQAGTLILTGSGSSVYAGECLSPGLQARLRLPVRAVPAGEILTHPAGHLPPSGPCLVVSLARSGNSPESSGVVDALGASAQCRHLVITCNRQGRLATRYTDDPRVAVLVLDDKTCDRSLVMTSSFTNMALAGQLLGLTGEPAAFESRGEAAARLGAALLAGQADTLARVARSSYTSAVYLGSGCRYGAARESALKMLEMTGGAVTTFAETFLGLRHGPMAAVGEGSMVVCFLSVDPVVRAYETDLVQELNRKKLGACKVLVGQDVPPALALPLDVIVELPGLEALGDEGAVLLDVMVGQLLALFRCLAAGLRPDMPSDQGVISRVVEDFAIHRRS